jgi:hypothetical protein
LIDLTLQGQPTFERVDRTLPLPQRHRLLSRTGNRQIYAALHHIAITQLRWNPDAANRLAAGVSNPEPGALRALKRRPSNVAYRDLRGGAIYMHTRAQRGQGPRGLAQEQNDRAVS